MIEAGYTPLEHKRHEFDVCVVGGGMAGMCAAIAAARNGAKTAIVQDRSMFGGNASSEVRMWICGAQGKNMRETGVLEEICLENEYLNPTGNYSIWDSVLYGAIRYQPNLTGFLNCTCTDCETEGEGDEIRINAIKCWQLTNQTWHTIGAKVFIDCSGDSILAPLSGALHRQGREAREEFDEDIEPKAADRKTMGNSILIQIRRTEQPQSFVAPSWAYKFEQPEDLPHRMSGVNGANFWWIELGGLEDTIGDSEEICERLMRSAWGVWDYIKNRAPERERAECWGLEWIGSLPGKRENRRYVGAHMMTQHDVRACGPFADVVAYGGWPMDDHHTAGLLYPGKPTIFHPAPSPFGIPLRSLYSRNVENLMMAGRNISVTHAALSATRVMATCSVIGQAAGTSAALAVQKGVSPGGIFPNHIPELQQILMEDDCYLPGFTRKVNGLTQRGRLDGDAPLNNGLDRPIGEEGNAWTGALGDGVTLSWDSPVEIKGARFLFDSDLDKDRKMPCSFPQKPNSRVPKTLVKKFRLEAQEGDGNWRTVFSEDNNHQRLVRVPLELRAQSLRLVAEETWGAERVRLFGFEALDRFEGKVPQTEEGAKWSDVVGAVDPADLAPPESEFEGGVESVDPADLAKPKRGRRSA